MPVPLYPHGAPKKPFHSLIANSLTLFEVENCCILVYIFSGKKNNVLYKRLNSLESKFAHDDFNV